MDKYISSTIGINKILSMKMDEFTEIINLYNQKKSEINDDDFSKTIFINSCKKHFLGETYDEYLKYECNISSPLEYHKRLINEGYLEFAPIEEQVDANFKVSDIKEILKQNRLKVSGKKDELIQRLFDEIGAKEIEGLLNKKLVTVSTKGELWLQEHIDYLLLRRINRSSSWKLHTVIKQNLHCDFYDAATITFILDILNETSSTQITATDVYFFLSNLHSLYTVDTYTPVPSSIADEYTNHINDIIFVMIRLLYIDICDTLPQAINTECFWEFNQFHKFDRYSILIRNGDKVVVDSIINQLYSALINKPIISKAIFLNITNNIIQITVNDDEVRSKLEATSDTWKSNNAKIAPTVTKSEIEYTKLKQIIKDGIIEIAYKLSSDVKSLIISKSTECNLANETFSIFNDFTRIQQKLIVDTDYSKTHSNSNLIEQSPKNNTPSIHSKQKTSSKLTIALILAAIFIIILLARLL